MKEIDREIFLLSYRELSVLLTAKGIQDVYLPKGDTLASNEKDLCYILNGMFQNGIINSVDDKFRIVEPLNSMLLGIGSAYRILFYRSMWQPEEVICVYMSDMQNIVLQIQGQNEKKIGIYTISQEAVLQLPDESPMKGWSYIPILDEEESYQSILEDKRPVSKDKLFIFHNIPYVLEALDVATGKITDRLMLRNTQDEEMIIYKKGKEVYSYPKNVDKLIELMGVIVGGKEYDNG